MAVQSWIAGGIVACAMLDITRRIFVSTLLEPVSGWLLAHGQVKWAMRLRHWKKS